MDKHDRSPPAKRRKAALLLNALCTEMSPALLKDTSIDTCTGGEICKFYSKTELKRYVLIRNGNYVLI